MCFDRDSRLNHSSITTYSEQIQSLTLVSSVDETSSLKRILVELLECKTFSVELEDVEEKLDDDLMVMLPKYSLGLDLLIIIFFFLKSSSSSKPFDMSSIVCFICRKKNVLLNLSLPTILLKSLINKYERLMSHLTLQKTEPTQFRLVAETKEKEWAYLDSSKDGNFQYLSYGLY